MHDDTSPLPDELDDGLAFAYGEESEAPPSPSVIERIAEATGSKPRILLRDESAGDTPMLRPLGPDDARVAGKYVVHGELGRGGVGAVHRGHDQDLGRDVAMKFLHEKYKGEPALLHRFVEEAQIGGQLQHPGIVPVYDLGMVNGRPFFSMKLVKGQTLAKKLAERASPAEERRTFLAIFEDVCQTLAYAHARGVVHRDLKPANIMIGSFGEVQVVDWGMGKVLPSGGVADEQLAAARRGALSVIETVRSRGHGTQSLVGSVMGTPAYMPPEQARGDVEQMDERSDVFALGAILCEILTGLPPYVGETDALIEMAAMARLDEAHARLAASDAEPEMVELATRCLMPAPAARPRSAEVVAEAVHDHLAAAEARVHEARVEAAEARVRAAALKRAQKLGIGLTAVIAAGLVVSLWFWRLADAAAAKEAVARDAAVASATEARESAQLAVEQTAVAQRELARAKEIKTLVTEMLESVDPDLARTADLTLLRDILDTAGERLANGAIDDELVAAELHALIGNVFRKLGLYAEAEPHLTAWVDLCERVLGEEHRNTLEGMDSLVTLYHQQGRYAEAEALSLQTLETMERVLGEEHLDTLEATENLALLYSTQGRYAEAESLFLETLEIRRRALGEEHPGMLGSLSNLATLYWNQGRHAEAEQLYIESLESQRRVLGEGHRSTLDTASNLAGLYQEQRRHAEAEPLYAQVLESQRHLLGRDHPTTMATQSNLATLYFRQGRYGEAEQLFLETLNAMKRALGEDHPSTLAPLHNLANVYRWQGRYAEAEPLYLEVRERLGKQLGEEHPNTLGASVTLALLYQSQGRDAEAEAILVETLATEERVLGEEHPTTLATTDTLATFYKDRDRYAEAEPLYLRTLQRAGDALGKEHPQTLGATTNLGLLYNAMGRFGEAAERFETSLPIKRRLLGLEHPWTGSALSGLVTAYEELGRSEEALPLKRELLGLKIAPADRTGASAAQLNAAAWALLTVEGELLREAERALGYAERACALAEEADLDPLWSYLDTLALAQSATGDVAAAVETQRRALSLLPPQTDPKTRDDLSQRLAEYEAAVEDR